MKAKNILALVVALSVGAAGAAGTVAGTEIKNTATATFKDPANPTTEITSSSNEVVTTVLPKPAFDIEFADGSTTDGGTQNVLGTSTSVTTGATPGQKVVTPYNAVNKGNVPLEINIAADTTGADAGQTVTYYPAAADADSDGVLTAAEIAAADAAPAGDAKKPITKVTVQADDPSTTTADEGVVKFFQVVDVPANATTSQTFGASPEGTVTGTGETANGYPTGTTNQEDGKAVNTDLQFHKITMFTPNIDNNPTDPSQPPPTPTDPDGNPHTPPATTTTVQVPTLPPNQPDPTLGTPPVDNPVPGYPSTDPTPVPIVPNLTGDEQIAYPPADPNNDPDKVTFKNNVTNSGGSPDKVQIFPTDAVDPTTGDLLPGHSFDPGTATFTYPDGKTVQFVKPGTTTPIPVVDDPNKTTDYPGFDVPAGGSVFYDTVVTYPDPDDSNPVAKITVPIGADSLNDADRVPEATTKNIIYPAAAQFGDTTPAQGAVPTPTPVQTVDPSAAASTTPQTSPDNSDSTAVFPMDVANNGQYAEDYTLEGSVDLDGDPATPPTPVKYYTAAGVELPKDSTGKYVTPVVAPGEEVKVLAVVDVPTGTQVGDYTVSQKATGRYSTIVMEDNNDIIRVSPVGEVSVAKFTKASATPAPAANAEHVINPGAGCTTGAPSASDPKQVGNPAGYTCQVTQYKPGDTYDYKIFGKNNYNGSAVADFALSDTLDANLTYNSATCTVTVPSGTAPTCAVNHDAATRKVTTTLTPASLPAGATVELTINVTVK